MYPYTKLGAWVKQRRKALDLTQDELARKIGYAVSTIRKIEAGDLRPSREAAERLAMCLEIQSSDLQAFLRVARAPQTGADRPAPASPPAIAYRPLPSNPIALIGRERELSYIKRQLQRSGMRLFTLIGPPGIGKTRLAIAAAWSLGAEFPDGICYVPLEAVAEPAAVLAAIGEALDVREHAGQPLITALQRAIGSRRLLLVLDNMEHVLAAGADIAHLLRHCPELNILATSRALLRLSGEQGIPVLPLTKPPLTPIPPWHSLEVYDAVRLFVSCAQLVQPAFKLTAENAAAVATICARLDGLPLAIELIASRIKILSPQHLLERLEILLGTAQNKQFDRPQRQQTLRAAIEWSYRLLAPREQHLFRRLGLFEGGATIEAVEAIYASLGDDPADSAEVIEGLLDHSLAQSQPDWGEQPRFTMLTILREYALEQLALAGEREALEEAFADYYLGLAQRANAAFRSPQEPAWQNELTREQGNLRAVLRWGLERGRPATTMRLGGLIWRHWMFRGHIGEGRRWLSQALAAESRDDAEVRASALHASGALASLQGDFDQALDYYERCLVLRRELDDRAGQAVTLLNCSSIARQRGDYSRAEDRLDQIMALYLDLGDLQGCAMALTELGLVAQGQGDYEASAICFRDALAIQRDLGNQFAIANLLGLQGGLEQDQGHHEQAKALFLQAIESQRAIGDHQSILRPLDGLASIMLRAGDLPAAGDAWLECLEHSLAQDKPQVAVKALEGFAQIAGAAGQGTAAAQLWGLAESIRASINNPVPAALTAQYAQAQELARQAIGQAAWVAAWREGAALTIDQGYALVLGAPWFRPAADQAD